MGDESAALEAEWAATCDVRTAVHLANGTLALEGVLRCSGIGPGDEVIVPAFGFNASVSAVLSVGATPVFADVLEDFTIDPAAVAAAIGPRTAAVMPVHLFGLMADMPMLDQVAGSRGLLLVEDAAQAIGASIGDRRPGRSGPAVFSLYATKNVTSGEGGIVATNDELLAERLRRYRDHGSRRRYEHESLGTNLRPTDIGAAIARVQLARLGRMQRRRSRNAATLASVLAGVPGVEAPVSPPGRVHAWHQFTIRIATGRDRVAAELAGLGVGTAVHYPLPLYRQPYLEGLLPEAARAPQRLTERLCREVLSLPVRPNLTPAEIDHVAASLAVALRPRRARSAGAT